ncbi:sigma factor-like helix-turn-helix DNA-binding protein [Streptomyces sp. NPDC002688]|uniref:RNA polymerase sigma factor n=1 Tax=Streptomyces sp. NPDC002688 TaxID=3154423 RepID=UPI00331730CD
MRSNTAGGPETQSMSGAGDADEDLPEDIQRDVDRVAELLETGFAGRLWQQTAAELYGYAFKPLLTAMRRTDKLTSLTRSSLTPLYMSDEERSTLHRNPKDREDLAVRTIDVALETFPQLLKDGGYAPAANRGKNGRPTKLTSFFYGRCGLVFPRVFYVWRDERTDRFERHAQHMSDDTLAHALGLNGTQTEPAGVIELCDTLTDMINGLKPRDRAVWQLTLDGLSQGEIADRLGIKTGDVENARFAFRTKVKTMRKNGLLTVPPEIDAEWVRTTSARAAAKGAGR